jgi:hypothetical protein
MIIYRFLSLFSLFFLSLSSELFITESNYDHKSIYLSKFINSSNIPWFIEVNYSFHTLNLEVFRTASINSSYIEISETTDDYKSAGNFQIKSVEKNGLKENFFIKNTEKESTNNELSCFYNKPSLNFSIFKENYGISNFTSSQSYKNLIFSFKSGRNGLSVFMNFGSEFTLLDLSNHSEYNFSSLEVMNLFVKDDFLLIQSNYGKVLLFKIYINFTILRDKNNDLFHLTYMNSFIHDEFIEDVLINFNFYKGKILLFNRKGMKIFDSDNNIMIYHQSLLDSDPFIKLNINDVIVINNTMYLLIKGYGLKLADLSPLKYNNTLIWLNNSFIHPNLISFDLSKNTFNQRNTLGIQVFQDNNIEEFFMELILINESQYEIYRVYTADRKLEVDNFISDGHYSYFFDKNSKNLISFPRGSILLKNNEYLITGLSKVNIESSIYNPMMKIYDYMSKQTKIFIHVFSANYILIDEIKFINPSFYCNFQKSSNYTITVKGMSEECIENGIEMKRCIIEMKISLFSFSSREVTMFDIQNLLGLILTLCVILLIYSFILIIRKKINERKQIYDTIIKQDETELDNK